MESFFSPRRCLLEHKNFCSWLRLRLLFSIFGGYRKEPTKKRIQFRQMFTFLHPLKISENLRISVFRTYEKERLTQNGLLISLANIYRFKVNNRNTRKRWEMYSKLTIKTPERHHWRRFGVFIVNFEHISHFLLVFLSLTFDQIHVTWVIFIPHLRRLAQYSKKADPYFWKTI